MGLKVTKVDTDGAITDPNTLGDLSIDNYVAGGDAGRLYYNDGISDIGVARKDEVSNVDNTSDADKPVSIAQQAALNLKANQTDVVALAGTQTITGDKTFSGTVEVPTPAAEDNSTKVASTAFVQQELAANIGFTDAGPGLSSVGSTVNFYPYGLSTITESTLGLNDYVVVSDSTVPRKISVQDFADEINSGSTSKNQCTAWVNFDGTTTPPTIRDSFNVSDVVYIGNGIADVYFETSMDNINYSVSGSYENTSQANYSNTLSIQRLNSSKEKVRITLHDYNSYRDKAYWNDVSVQVFGGKE